MARGDKAKAIRAALAADPKRRNADIARELGVSPEYVSVVRHRARVIDPGAKREARVLLTGANSLWIAAEAARLQVTPTILIDAIVTDARLDAEGTA